MTHSKLENERFLKQKAQAKGLVHQARSVTKLLGTISESDAGPSEYQNYLHKRSEEIQLKKNLLPENDMSFLKDAAAKYRSDEPEKFMTKFDVLDERLERLEVLMGEQKQEFLGTFQKFRMENEEHKNFIIFNEQERRANVQWAKEANA